MSIARPPGKTPRGRSAAGNLARLSATPAAQLNEGALKELIGYQLAQASIVTLGIFGEFVGQPHSLKTVDYTMLALIQANPGLSPAQLRKALALSAPYVTAGLDKLHERGLILREVNQTDRRAQHLRLTKSAERFVSELTRELLDSERARFETLTFAEQRMLAELLHKLAISRRQPHPG
jgi:DNA-binding MarR family transcriptional regulator